jgi:3'-phosphoadenosine 5'-phosphosulfate sulfotransferase (PAPS reductase)/FAD synthetase
MRYVCQFSCGAASAVATKLTLKMAKPEDEIVIVNAFIKEEHEDNRRFLADCEKWFDHPVTVLRDTVYGASTDEVWKRKRYMKGMQGAPCSQELKRKLLKQVSRPGDITVLGFTREEEDRLRDLEGYYPNEKFSVPLIEEGLDKGDCLAIVERAGIVLPAMYLLGYDNANCIGCPKGGQNYWQKIRHDFPERFIEIQTIQEEIGPGAYFIRFRNGEREDERMSLRELPEGKGNLYDEPSFSCSFFCQWVEEKIAS